VLRAPFPAVVRSDGIRYDSSKQLRALRRADMKAALKDDTRWRRSGIQPIL